MLAPPIAEEPALDEAPPLLLLVAPAPLELTPPADVRSLAAPPAPACAVPPSLLVLEHASAEQTTRYPNNARLTMAPTFLTATLAGRKPRTNRAPREP
jgi:hypothetical protein